MIVQTFPNSPKLQAWIVEQLGAPGPYGMNDSASIADWLAQMIPRCHRSFPDWAPGGKATVSRYAHDLIVQQGICPFSIVPLYKVELTEIGQEILAEGMARRLAGETK